MLVFETLGHELDLSPYPSLANSRAFSRDAISAVATALSHALDALGEPVMTVAVGGSLGRLEASAHSDIDCMIIVDDRGEFEPEHTAASVKQICAELRRTGLQPPKTDGIYCRPVRRSSLLDPTSRGSLTEEPAIFGTRMQLLLDARPVYRADEFSSLTDQLLNWYGCSQARGSHFTHLLNDLSRYLHAYAVWQQFKFSCSDRDGWYLRQAKLRSTRIATFAGLLFAIGETTVSDDAMYLAQTLNRTPLGRIQSAFDNYAPEKFTTVIEIYEQLHQMLCDASIRSELIRLSPASQSEIPDQHVGAYALIHDLSDQLMTQLTQFILSRGNDWSPRILRSWLL